MISYHMPLSSSMAIHWHRKIAHTRPTTIALQQRERAHRAKETSSGSWTEFADRAKDLFAEDWSASMHTVQSMHTRLRQHFAESFPPAGHAQPSWQINESAVQQKWTLWHKIQTHDDHSRKGLFHVWHQYCMFQKLHRLHQQYAKDWRQRRIKDLMTEVAEAAARHDTYKAYQLINQISPKAVRKRIQLRDNHGQPLGPMESHAALGRYVLDTWAAPLTARSQPHTPTEFSWRETLLPIFKCPSRWNS